MLTKRDLQALRSLLRYSKSLPPPGDREQRDLHFALGVHKKVCVHGHNTFEPKGEYSDIHEYSTPHAESSVLLQMEDVTSLYVIRLNSKGEYLLSYPCSECLNFIKLKKVRKLIYSIKDGLKKIYLI